MNIYWSPAKNKIKYEIAGQQNIVPGLPEMQYNWNSADFYKNENLALLGIKVFTTYY